MIQSISDIITNSSSEVFVVSTDKHAEVAEFIKNICDIFGVDMDEIMEFDSATKNGYIKGWDIKFKKGDLIMENLTELDNNSYLSILITDVIFIIVYL